MAVTYLFLDKAGSVLPIVQDSILRAVEDLAYTLSHPVLKIIVKEVGVHMWAVSVFSDAEEPTEEWTVTIEDEDEAHAE